MALSPGFSWPGDFFVEEVSISLRLSSIEVVKVWLLILYKMPFFAYFLLGN